MKRRKDTSRRFAWRDNAHNELPNEEEREKGREGEDSD